MSHRTLCLRCRRPQAVCFCAHLPSLPTRTRVMFLQHPRESRMAVGTARMAHLSLPNSELHTGVVFDETPRVRELMANPEGVAVLFPGEGAIPPASLRDTPPRTLIVIDGTWPQARKVFKQNTFLHSLPRIGFVPKAPGNYRIRREPKEDFVSTIEAVVEVLGELEGKPEEFSRMLGAFDWMVDQQLLHKEKREGPSRYLNRRALTRPKSTPLPAELLARRDDLVLVYAEGNAPGLRCEEQDQFDPELVQLVAERLSTGERFEALVAPRKPLADSIPDYTELDRDAILGGEAVEPVLERWKAFLRPNDVLVTWGFFTVNLLEKEKAALPRVVDLRLATTKCLKKRTGGVESALELLAEAVMPGVPVSLPTGRGRALRRLSGMSKVLELLVRREEGKQLQLGA